MLTLAVVPAVAIGVAFLTILVIHHLAASQRRSAGTEIDQEVQDKLKRSTALDSRLAHDLLSGADVDSSITDFTKSRAAIHAVPSDTPWMWEPDDVVKWAKHQLALKAGAITHKARVTAMCVLVCILLLAGVADAILYSQLASSNTVLSPPPKPSIQPLGAPTPSAMPAVDPLPPPSPNP